MTDKLRNLERLQIQVCWGRHVDHRKNADNPWRHVLHDYAGRLILQADYGVIVKRSKRGTPVRGKRHTSPKHYMFNEMVEPHWGLTSNALEPEQSDIEALVAEDMVPEPAVSPDDQQLPREIALVGSSETVVAELVVPTEDRQESTLPVSAPAADEYALPPHITHTDAEKLRSAGKQWVDMDQDWPLDLKCAIGWSSTNEADVIADVERAKAPPPGEAPFSYFLDAAKRDGVDAGHAAYREATIRRFAFEFATMDRWKDIRANLGLAL